MFPRSRQEFLPFVRDHWRSLLLLSLSVLIPLLLVTHFTHEIFREGGYAWDQAILDWYRARRTPALTATARTLATLGGPLVLPVVTAVIALLLARAHARAHGWFLILGVAGATLLNVAAKVVFQRPRPDELLAVLAEPGFSFPSGHAMANAAFGLALALVFWRSRAGWPVAVFGILWGVTVGVSRNYLGVHYPSDVLVGFLSSTAWVYGLHVVMQRRWPNLRKSPGGVRDTR
ncbi:phosphatase PAP2 family protein [Deinococcus depolymerans]|uniref:Phosphatase PAP2 family protein n=1 Tax=Deinococcus depolymerans TaxID=392408 RepID=A0ABP3MJ08_9DEIO